MNSIAIPDLRFEQSFMKSLSGYASKDQKPHKDEILNIKHAHDIQEKPLITPGIVVYAIIKDQIIMPMVQGFLWTGFLISITPVLNIIVRQGQIAGTKLYNMIGLGRVPTRHVR